MAKRGQKIDELYLSLGLDIAQLQLDFDTAGKTVSQAMARLNSKETQLKLRMDIDLTKLEGAGTELDKLKVKYEAINRQLDVQKQKEQVLAAVLKDAQKTSGMDSAAASRAETNLLRQQRIVAQTEAELRRLGKAYGTLGQQMNAAGQQAGSFGARMQRGIAQAHTGLTKLSNGFSLLNAKTAAVMAAVSTGAGLFTLTKGAMEAGENVYRLSKRLHTSAGEAAQLNRTFQLAGMDVMTVIPLIAKLDKQIESAGTSGNETTEALARFGVTIQDQQGNLLPLNDQLAQLAKGYQYAVDMGQEEAYTAEVLGARGAALVPLLEQYQDLMQISANVQTTGLLNPEESHKTWLEWKQMEMELGQLKGAIGAALLPVSKELMPEVPSARAGNFRAQGRHQRSDSRLGDGAEGSRGARDVRRRTNQESLRPRQGERMAREEPPDGRAAHRHPVRRRGDSRPNVWRRVPSVSQRAGSAQRERKSREESR